MERSLVQVHFLCETLVGADIITDTQERDMSQCYSLNIFVLIKSICGNLVSSVIVLGGGPFGPVDWVPHGIWDSIKES